MTLVELGGGCNETGCIFNQGVVVASSVGSTHFFFSTHVSPRLSGKARLAPFSRGPGADQPCPHYPASGRRGWTTAERSKPQDPGPFFDKRHPILQRNKVSRSATQGPKADGTLQNTESISRGNFSVLVHVPALLRHCRRAVEQGQHQY
jgi:hypothetical protein